LAQPFSRNLSLRSISQVYIDFSQLPPAEPLSKLFGNAENPVKVDYTCERGCGMKTAVKQTVHDLANADLLFLHVNRHIGIFNPTPVSVESTFQRSGKTFELIAVVVSSATSLYYSFSPL